MLLLWVPRASAQLLDACSFVAEALLLPAPRPRARHLPRFFCLCGDGVVVWSKWRRAGHALDLGPAPSSAGSVLWRRGAHRTLVRAGRGPLPVQFLEAACACRGVGPTWTWSGVTKLPLCLGNVPSLRDAGVCSFLVCGWHSDRPSVLLLMAGSGWTAHGAHMRVLSSAPPTPVMCVLYGAAVSCGLWPPMLQVHSRRACRSQGLHET